jgi:predicted O-linked N-acetylglucosamine transferase (SPINDLY family)
MNRKQRKATADRPRGSPTGASTETGSVLRRLVAEADRCSRAGRFQEAAAAYRKAIVLEPLAPGPHLNLGVVLRVLGRLDEAATSLQSGLSLAPNVAEGHYNLAIVRRAQGDTEAALDSYRRAIALRPDFVEAHCNLGNVLHALGRLDEAEAALRSGLSLAPSDAEIHNNLAGILAERGKYDEAIELYAKAVALQPDFAEALSNLADARRKVCDWRNFADDEAACRDLVRRDVRGINPAQFLSLTASAAEQAQCARRHAAAIARGAAALPPPARRSRERLRIGYLSGDFREHPVAELAVDLFERHDRDRFDVSGYSFGPKDGSGMRRRLMETLDQFIDISTQSHAEAANRIRADGIDVLVDLTGLGSGARTAILAARPAPIQVNFLGFLGTMGAGFIDYIIADPVVLPMTEQPFFDERIVHLPDCFMPSDTRSASGEQMPTRAQCGLPEQGFVFCCFNRASKITPALFDVWMGLLQTVRGSVLWLLESAPGVMRNLRREAAARGVAVDRLVFARHVPLPEHLARQRLADLFLDTLPCNAQAMANLALGAGLPLLTCSGDRFIGRCAASQLRAAGLPELVTHTLEEYEQLAARLATDSTLLSEFRHRVLTARGTAPLFDTVRYARHLEAAYQRMWDIWATGKAPEPFAVAQ